MFNVGQHIHCIYTPASKKGGVYCISPLRRTFLSNHASQPFQTCYGALTRGHTGYLPNSGLPVIYFLFHGSVHFWILHLGIAGLYTVKNSDFLFFQKKHCVLTGVHPSPLSAHRGFFGCKHFSKCNEYLQKCGKTPIDWNDLPVE